VTVAKERHELKLSKGAAFDKARLKRLRQEDETWEADFRALPKPIMQNETHYLGMVVKKRGGSVLADTKVEGRPSAHDLATLLAKAMRQPLTGSAHRPRRIHVRGHRQWPELFPHLTELGIDVSVWRELPKVQKAYEDHLRQMREVDRAGMLKPTAEQQSVEELFPAIARPSSLPNDAKKTGREPMPLRISAERSLGARKTPEKRRPAEREAARLRQRRNSLRRNRCCQSGRKNATA
jgi:hypothetical protein